MKFSRVAEVFLAIAQEPSRTKMTELIAALLAEATPEEAQLISYLCLGLLRAPYKGNQFNFAEKSMIKVLADIAKQDHDMYKKFVKKLGGVGVAVLEAEWPYNEEDLTLQQVYTRLEELMSISGTGSQEEKAAFLTNLLAQVGSSAASVIVRIVVGTMRLGFSDMTLLDALSWMVTGDKSQKKALEAAYNMQADIGRIAYLLKDKGIEVVKEVQPFLGIPIRLAAAERAVSPKAILDKIGPCDSQPKLDGFRLQIHIDIRASTPKIWFFSRNLLNMSAMFPDLQEALAGVKATTLVVEGEAIVYDEETERFLPFQETVKRRRKHDIQAMAESLPLRLYLFDILYVNGEPVLKEGHEQRRALLINLFGHYTNNVVHVIAEKRTSTVPELTDYFNEQITQGLEGLVVRRPDAPYQPGKRNFNWIKLKRHQEGELTDTIDAVVLGYYAGKGKRAQFGIGAFLVGIYNKKTDMYETLAKVGTGLTDQEWIDLKKRCDKQMVHQKPGSVISNKELNPDVWVDPTIVVVVLADEITQSPMHTAGKTETTPGLALRFPRFMGYALDKKPDQATSTEEARRLYELQYNT